MGNTNFISREQPPRMNSQIIQHLQKISNILKKLESQFEIFESQMKNPHYNLLIDILKTKSAKTVAQNLNISTGTVGRWLLLKNVPPHYIFDLMKITNKPIDYTKFSYKEKDQYFTPVKTATYCYSKFLTILKSRGDKEKLYTYIEPSAGCGNFLKILPIGRSFGLDIEPQHKNVSKGDYLEWTPTKSNNPLFSNASNKYVVIGNPPFGLRGQLALKFINHSYKFAAYVGFILPQLFESDGKGSPRKRVKGYNLIHSEKIKTHFTDPSERIISVKCIFQIWSKAHVNKLYNLKNVKSDTMVVYSLSDGGTPSTTRNKKMHEKCHLYLPSTCFGAKNMKYYDTFQDLPGKKGYGVVFLKDIQKNISKFKIVKWHEKAFLSTNSAYNIRTSQILQVFT
mgnify:CR=1 FL=1